MEWGAAADSLFLIGPPLPAGHKAAESRGESHGILFLFLLLSLQSHGGAVRLRPAQIRGRFHRRHGTERLHRVDKLPFPELYLFSGAAYDGVAIGRWSPPTFLVRSGRVLPRSGGIGQSPSIRFLHGSGPARCEATGTVPRCRHAPQEMR